MLMDSELLQTTQVRTVAIGRLCTHIGLLLAVTTDVRQYACGRWSRVHEEHRAYLMQCCFQLVGATFNTITCAKNTSNFSMQTK